MCKYITSKSFCSLDKFLPQFSIANNDIFTHSSFVFRKLAKSWAPEKYFAPNPEWIILLHLFYFIE